MFYVYVRFSQIQSIWTLLMHFVTCRKHQCLVINISYNTNRVPVIVVIVYYKLMHKNEQCFPYYVLLMRTSAEFSSSC